MCLDKNKKQKKVQSDVQLFKREKVAKKGVDKRMVPSTAKGGP